MRSALLRETGDALSIEDVEPAPRKSSRTTESR